MHLLPLLNSDIWGSTRPSRILDQHFGLGLDDTDLLAPLTLIHPFSALSLVRRPLNYYRPWRSHAAQSDIGSAIKSGKDKFVIILDVQQFSPEEITVKVTGNNTITVEGKHEEKQDEHGFIFRHFLRRYIVPEGSDINNAVSSLSSDGVLSITAPRIGHAIEEHRTIPIQQTGTSVKTVEVKKEGESGEEK